MNNIILSGNLGKDPELKTLPSGKKVCKFSLASRDKRGDKDLTEWSNITVFGYRAEKCAQFLERGSSVILTGRKVTNKWKGKDGNDKYMTEIQSFDVYPDFPKSDAPYVPGEDKAEDQNINPQGPEDDLPF